MEPSLLRIKELVLMTQECDFNNFTLAINLCLDEILVLKIPDRLGFTEDERLTKQQQIQSTTADFMAFMTGEKPQFSTFTTSGMQSISMSIQSVLTAARVGDRELSMCVGDRSYFEIPHSLLLSSKPQLPIPDVGDLYKVSKSGAFSEFTPEEQADPESAVVDLYVGAYENNVELSSPGNKYNDINRYVAKQFELRDRMSSSGAGGVRRPLVVLIDNTLSRFDDIHITWLLVEFADKIESGELAVVVANSCNKQFHMGTDKTPLGLLSVYAQPDKFPYLTRLTTHEIDTLSIAEMSPFSPTLSLATQIMTDCTGMISTFADKVSARVRFLHDKVFDSTLQFNHHCISIDTPLNKARFDGLPTEDRSLESVWPFVSVRIKLPDQLQRLCPGLAACMLSQMCSMLRSAGVSPRDGYGFSTSSVATIQSHVVSDKILRISVGAESMDHLSPIASLLNEYMLQVNELFDPLCTTEQYALNIKQFNQLNAVYLDKAKALLVEEDGPRPCALGSMG